MADENAPIGAQGEPEQPSVAAEPQGDAGAEAEGTGVTIQVEEAGPCARRVKIEVAAGRVRDEVDKSYEDLRKTVFIKGFRRGHVPRHVLERRFGQQVLDGVRQSLVDDAFGTAVQEHALRVALAPTVDYTQFPIALDKPLSFEIQVEVAPEFTLDNYRGLTAERPHVEVAPQEVDRALEGFRLRHGDYSKVEEGEVRENDIPVCHAIAIHGGEEVWRENELGVNLTAETLGGMAVPGLRAGLLGARLGESRTFQIALPDDFKAEAHRGKQVDLEVTLDEVRRFEAPEATDAWARSLRFDGLEDLRDELYDELRRQREQEADDLVQERVAEQLLTLTDFDVPEGLVARITERMKERQRVALLYRGVPADEIDKLLEQYDTRTRESSARHCKLYFIYEKIADQEKIFVTEDELEQRIQAIALNYRRRPEEVKTELESEGRLSSLRQQMREEKVRDFLVQQARVTEAPKPSAEPVAEATVPPADAGAEAAEPARAPEPPEETPPEPSPGS